MSALEQIHEPVKVTRASLRAVPGVRGSRAWPKGSFPVVILALLAVGMVGHLVLQTKIQEQGFELAALQTRADNLSAQESILNASLDRQFTPQQLAYAASMMGMVANPHSTYLVLPTGEIQGTNLPAKGNEVPFISAPPQIFTTATPVDPLQSAMAPVEEPAPPVDTTPPADTTPVEEPVAAEAEPVADAEPAEDAGLAEDAVPVQDGELEPVAEADQEGEAEEGTQQ